MTHACAVVDYFEDVIGLTRHDEISEEFAFFLDWRLSRWCCGPNPCRESVRLASWEGVVILSRGFCGEGSMDLLAAQILPSRRTWGSRLLQACHPEARVLCGPRDLLSAATIGAVAMNCFGFGRITAKRPEEFLPQSVRAPEFDLDHGLSSRNGKPYTIAAYCFLPRKPEHRSTHAPTR